MAPASQQNPNRRRPGQKRTAPSGPAATKSPQQPAPSDADSFSQLKGKVVWAPAGHFGIEVPGMFYRVRVTRRDTRRRNAVVIRFFEDDGSQYWLPMDQVLRWLKEPNNPDGRCTHRETDNFAAQTLVDLKSGWLGGRADTTEIDETDVSVSNVLLEMSAMDNCEASTIKAGGPASQTSGSPASVGTEVHVREHHKKR